MKREMIKPIFVLTIVGFICSVVLYFVYELTDPLIEFIIKG
jgi:hypothetical protein